MGFGFRFRKIFDVSLRYSIPFSMLLFLKAPIWKNPAVCARKELGADSEVERSLLDHVDDKYNGIVVTDKLLAVVSSDFELRLRDSLATWKVMGKKGIWLKIPREKIELAKIAVEQGFEFHHAEKDYLMLTTWIANSENKLPPNASHQVGVGCIVCLNGKILCVQEKFGPLRGTGIWKIPTGLVDAGENLAVAAVREVQEETGISTEFRGVVGIRHAHNMPFGKSDLFFMCVLSPLTSKITIQESEIEASEWITFDEYFSQPVTAGSELDVRTSEIIKATIDGKQTLMDESLLLSRFGSQCTLYSPATMSNFSTER